MIESGKYTLTPVFQIVGVPVFCLTRHRPEPQAASFPFPVRA